MGAGATRPDPEWLRVVGELGCMQVLVRLVTVQLLLVFLSGSRSNPSQRSTWGGWSGVRVATTVAIVFLISTTWLRSDSFTLLRSLVSLGGLSCKCFALFHTIVTAPGSGRRASCLLLRPSCREDCAGAQSGSEKKRWIRNSNPNLQ